MKNLAYNEDHTLERGIVMTKITDMIVSAILKKGIVNEMRNINLELDIPEMKGTLKITIDNMTTRFEKDEKEA